MSTLGGLDREAFWERMDRVIESIPHEGNRETVRTYLQERHVQVAQSTVGNDANAIADFARFLGDTALEDLTREDAVAFFGRAKKTRLWRSRIDTDEESEEPTYTTTEKETDLQQSTLENRFFIIRRFYSWLLDEDNPGQFRNLKPKGPKKDSIPVDELITREDLQTLLKAARGPQEKATLALLRETGLRNSEACNLQIRSIDIRDDYAIVTIPKTDGDGQPVHGNKTGARQVWAVDTRRYLYDWIRVHPDRDDPHASLFVNEWGDPITTQSMLNRVQRIADRAGLDKHVTVHLFRHSAATEKARMGWVEGKMRAYFGWARESDMPSRYVHLAGRDYMQQDLEKRGVLDTAEHATPALQSRICPRCDVRNPVEESFCQKCEYPIAPDAVERMEATEKARVLDVLMELAEDETLGEWTSLVEQLQPGDNALVFEDLEPVPDDVSGEDLEQHAREQRDS